MSIFRVKTNAGCFNAYSMSSWIVVDWELSLGDSDNLLDYLTIPPKSSRKRILSEKAKASYVLEVTGMYTKAVTCIVILIERYGR